MRPVFFFLSLFVFLFLLLPWQYLTGECKKVADDFHDALGGSLVFLQPNTYPDQIGHWLNKIYIHDRFYYIDYQNQRIFEKKEDVNKWYLDMNAENNISSMVIVE